jgi:hypothetical protein
MPRNGTGTYSLPAGNPVSAGTVISETWANTTLVDLATAVTQSLAADGQTVLTADLGMSNNKLTALADGTAVTHAATLGQVQKNAACVLSSVAGGTLAYTATLPYSTTALSTGQKVVFVPNATNTGAVTLAINGGTAKGVLRSDGTASQAGDLLIGVPYELIWDGTNWRSLTTVVTGVYAPLASPTFTGTVTMPGTVNGLTAAMVSLGNVTNESKATMFTSPTFTGTVALPAGWSINSVAVTATAAQINAACVTYPPSSGTYAPTPVAGVNCGSPVQGVGQWMRVGNIVHVTVTVRVTATTAANITFGVPLPVASNFTATTQAVGVVGTAISGSYPCGVVYADATNDRVTCGFTPTDTNPRDYFCVFQYEVL